MVKEPTEYEHLVSRQFKDYQPMHQALYKVIVELLRNKPANILEIGFGIGYGLHELLKANCINTYFGIEKDKDCFDYVRNYIPTKYWDSSTILLENNNWLTYDGVTFTTYCKYLFDFSLCIEVIEHLNNKEEVIQTINKISKYTKKYLFLSTPDKNTDPHGKFTKQEVKEIILNSGFKEVVSIEWQLPHTLFIATKEKIRCQKLS